jgi:hypothetical protein
MDGNENPAAAGEPQAGLIENAFDSQEYSNSAPPEQAPEPVALATTQWTLLADDLQRALAGGVKRDIAIALARLGFRVFPLAAFSKLPDIDAWPERATNDEAQVHAWFTCPLLGLPVERNIGIATGRGLQVIDLDDKAGRTGSANFTLLEDLKDAPVGRTFTVRTANGGLHKYVLVDGPYRNSAGDIAEGVDTRGDGGMVVGPGSTVVLDDEDDANG